MRIGTKVTSLCTPRVTETRRSAVDTPSCRPNDGPVTYNLAELFERVVDTVPEREAVVTPTRRLTFAELDARANQLAHHLCATGIRPGDHVGLQLMNGTEYLEAMLAAFKLRAVPVNINYRYVEAELSYLYENADLVALVYDTAFAARVDAARSTTVPRHLIAVRRTTEAALPGSVEYEAALAAASPERDFSGRSGDDLYIAYTGGTTGPPKGVLWRHEDIFFAAMGGGDPTTLLGPITEPGQIVERVLPVGAVMLMAPPLIHVSAQWGAFSMMYGGSKVVLTSPGSFDPEEVLRLATTESVNVLTLVGDAMARPVLDALADHPDRYDLSSLLVFASGGAVLSASTKAQVADLLPGVIAVDGLGSTETGVTGTRARLPGADVEQGAKFTVGENIAVLDDDLRPVAPGSRAVGYMARKGHLPIGYYKDAQKSAALIVKIGGERWALTGDAAAVEEDGTVVLLGRGSVSINTGGEKVYPEEVEGVVKDHAAVYDAVVVGTPDPRWGEQVVAVVQLRPGATLTVDELRQHCRHFLAGYKLPHELVRVEHVERGPNGKADYRWARERAHLGILRIRATRPCAGSRVPTASSSSTRTERATNTRSRSRSSTRPAPTRRRPTTRCETRCAKRSRCSSPSDGGSSECHSIWRTRTGLSSATGKSTSTITCSGRRCRRPGAPRAGRGDLDDCQRRARSRPSTLAGVVRRGARDRRSRIRRKGASRARRRHVERANCWLRSPPRTYTAPRCRHRPSSSASRFRGGRRCSGGVCSTSCDSVSIFRPCSRTWRYSRTLRKRGRAGEPRAAKPFAGPHTRFDRPLTPNRRLAYETFALDDIKSVAHSFDARVTDVVVAMVSGALRSYLERHGELPDQPLTAAIPVSVRTPEEERAWGNRLASWYVSLATDVADPTERLRAIVRYTRAARAELEATDPELQHRWAEYWRLFRLTTFAFPKMARPFVHRPTFNVIISTVPGPPRPLYRHGARLVHMISMGPLVEGMGINFTGWSYAGDMTIAVMSCREHAPDLWDLTGDLRASLEDLMTAAVAARPTEDRTDPRPASDSRAPRTGQPRQ